MSRRAQRRCALAGLALMCALAPGAHAQVFYSYPGARPVTDTSPSIGLVSGFGDNVIRLGGFGRFNLSSSMDLGIEAMYNSVDAEGSADDFGFGGAGLDGKYLLIPADEDMPLDVALQAGVGFLARDDYLLIHAPFGGIASHDFLMNDGRTITAFGGVYFVFDYIDVGDADDTDFDAELRIGGSAEIVKRGSVFAALHTGIGTMFFLGFNAGL